MLLKSAKRQYRVFYCLNYSPLLMSSPPDNALSTRIQSLSGKKKQTLLFLVYTNTLITMAQLGVVFLMDYLY